MAIFNGGNGNDILDDHQTPTAPATTPSTASTATTPSTVAPATTPSTAAGGDDTVVGGKGTDTCVPRRRQRHLHLESGRRQ